MIIDFVKEKDSQMGKQKGYKSIILFRVWMTMLNKCKNNVRVCLHH